MQKLSKVHIFSGKQTVLYFSVLAITIEYHFKLHTGSSSENTVHFNKIVILRYAVNKACHRGLETTVLICS